MADNIVSSLFGLTPLQVQQQQQQALNQNAATYAQLDPFQRADYGIYKAAGQLAGAGAGMMGMVNPEVEQAKQQQAAFSGADTTTPEGLKALAQRFHSMGMPQQAMMAVQKANEIEAQRSKMALESAQTEKALREPAPEPEGKYSSNIAKFMAERSKYPIGSAQYNEYTAAIKKESYIKPEKEDKEGKQISNIDAKRISSVSTLGDAANPALQLLDQADALYGKYESGKDEPILGAMGKVGAIVGIGGDKAADYEVGDQIAKDLGVIKLGLIGGSDTERELKVAIDTSPSPDKRPSTNKTIIENQRRAIQVLQAQPDFMADWVSKYGSLSKLDNEGMPYGKAWRKYQKENFQPVKVPSDIKGTSQPAKTTGGWAIRPK